MIITILLSLLAFLTFSPSTTALTVHRSGDTLPYALTPWQFKGEIDGNYFEYNGTIEQAFAAYAALHPSFNLTAYLDTPHTESAHLSNTTTLSRRNKDGRSCCRNNAQGWKYASTDRIQEGIRYLQRFDICDVGPRTCNQISCSYDSAIILCNDNNYGIRPNCRYIASYATDLVTWCNWEMFTQVCGQEFDTDHYNVVVRKPDRHC
ncbi:hypothetical protein GLAREA_09381 [Glarea lozoyensis ATCC 20868]|uniref:Uncharacterized protein n=1 Tax=Glarea lozoyensis (strain ATCC 20868 / MF5171) TaxID=1116229 RepID=S3D8D5_GLAL2|nr:uncharacterized protein GLAREA_09381 [Glarea lozoyensis ATCC 20868]EPE28261.1 hypothetical protein GLAREA_09381 [Glarea lozoyensis ATCC 20868]